MDYFCFTLFCLNFWLICIFFIQLTFDDVNLKNIGLIMYKRMENFLNIFHMFQFK